jgi:glycosyltransferase involved in cell wall biosynthesis
LSELGQDVTVFACAGSEPIGDYKVHEYTEPMESFAADSINSDWFALEQKMFNECRSELETFDIVNGNNWFCLESQLERDTTFHTQHGHFYWERWPTNTHLITVSEYIKALAQYHFQVTIPKDAEIDVAYNGIDLKEYAYQKDKGDRLLFVGRFQTFKGAQVAAQVALLSHSGLDIVGSPVVATMEDSIYLTQLQAMAQKGDIKFHVEIPQKEKIRLYQNARCTLIPSNFGEPFGLVAPESLACGTPVITFRDGALPEIVTHECRIVVDDTVDMWHALKKIDDIRQEDCRKRAEFFSRERMAERYLEVYRKRCD